MGKYKNSGDDDIHIIDPEKQNIKFACCDCGSVHSFIFDLKEDGLIEVNIRADDRAAAQLRRVGDLNLIAGKHKKWKMIRS